VDYRHPIEALIPDAQGRILAALTRTDAELTLRGLAQLAEVSPTHVSRVMPRLVELGVVYRRDIGGTALFRLVDASLAARWLRALAGAREQLVAELRASTEILQPRPYNVTLFGSLARGDADAHSDLDLLVVAPGDPDDSQWRSSLTVWQAHVAEVAGNPVNLIEVDHADAVRQLRAPRGIWRAALNEGLRLAGEPLAELRPTKRRARVAG
jgi:predicted nucleotidyltransferase